MDGGHICQVWIQSVLYLHKTLCVQSKTLVYMRALNVYQITKYYWIIAFLRGDTPAERAGLRPGDRLITVNDVFVVFLPVSEVFKVLNMERTLVAWLEVER